MPSHSSVTNDAIGPSGTSRNDRLAFVLGAAHARAGNATAPRPYDPLRHSEWVGRRIFLSHELPDSGVDAAIIFSDILVVLEALGLPLTFATGDGPIPNGSFDGSTDMIGISIDAELAEPE